jgi:dihydrofolate synthase/folylpolyglutamate synthase
MDARAELQKWLSHCERLHPQTIDLGLGRVQGVRERLGLDISAVVVTVAGTNGKGSSCAMLEAIGLAAGWRVGVFTSPHLLHFEERCRLGGSPVDAADLVPHFEAVEAARQGTSLTYFEFTTLAILRLLAQTPLDLVVLEVGLGGRLDAVNIVDTDVALITSIDLDHCEWLGPDRESIGAEKAAIMRPGRPAVISDPMPPQSVQRHAQAVGADLWLAGRDFRHAGDRQQWQWAGRRQRLAGLAYPALRGANQLINASGVLAVWEALRDRLPVPVQAIRQGLAQVQLPGRFQIVPGQPTLVLDVAHNPHAAATLAVNLDQMGFYPRTLAVLGAMADKDLAGLVNPLVPLVDAWFCCDLPTPRAASATALMAIVQAAMATRRRPAAVGSEPLIEADPALLNADRPGLSRAAAETPSLSCHVSPAAALAAAAATAGPTDRILVFGSFFTVGGVLADGFYRSVARQPGAG